MLLNLLQKFRVQCWGAEAPNDAKREPEVVLAEIPKKSRASNLSSVPLSSCRTCELKSQGGSRSWVQLAGKQEGMNVMTMLKYQLELFLNKSRWEFPKIGNPNIDPK